MLAILAAALLAAASQNDTVFMADGGRVVGTVIEEAPQGVVVQLADGTVRRYPAREVRRIEYADGTVSASQRADAPASPPPGAEPPRTAPPSAPPPAAPPQPPYAYPPQPPPAYTPRPPPAYTPQPPPAYTPQPPPAPYEPRHRHAPQYRPYPPAPPEGYTGSRTGMAPVSPLYGVLGLGGLTLSGELTDGVSARRTYDPQFQVYLEGGLRLDPAVALGLYLDLGVGEPAAEVRATCGTGCTATTGRVGILLRHTFTPFARTAPWIAIGTGLEFGSVETDASMQGSMGGGSEVFSYSGWEALRLMAGVDIRSNPIFGFGLYGGVSFGTYSRYEDSLGPVDLGSQPYHTTVEAGVRMTLFP